MQIPEQMGLGFDPLDAAFLQPLPEPVRARRGRPAKQVMPGAPVTPAALKEVAAAPAARSSSAPVPSSGSVGNAPSAPLAEGGVSETPADPTEQMARQVAAHPDYRVLRRLVPRLDWGGLAPGAAQSDTEAGLRTLLVLDTETTGLHASRDKVIELALLRVTVDVRTGLPVGAVQVYDGLEDPGVPMPVQITEITGITTEMVRGQRLDEARVAELLRGVDLVVAHNAGFDRPFVEARLHAFAALAWACSLTDVDWKGMGQGSAKLENLALACGWFYDAHRAETDCHALLAVLAQPTARWGARQPASTQATLLNTLLEASEQTHHKLQATGAPFDAKDVLKARGYRWDGTQRVWGTVLRSETALGMELAWLAEAVYGGRATRVRVESVDARQRFANRPGSAQMRLVEPALLGG